MAACRGVKDGPESYCTMRHVRNEHMKQQVKESKRRNQPLYLHAAAATPEAHEAAAETAAQEGATEPTVRE